MQKHKQFPYPIYLVITEAQCLHMDWLEVAKEAIRAGLDIIQLREKSLPTEELYQRAKALKAICDPAEVPLIINDYPEIAGSLNTWGVHVGLSDTAPEQIARKYPQLNIGWSLESTEQLRSPQMRYVQHLGVSPIFDTPTKTDTKTAWGIAGLTQLREQTNLPLIAIGGINLQSVKEVVQAGADSLAIVSAICSSKDPYQATLALKESWSKAL